MRFNTISIFAVTASLIALAIANPVPNLMVGGGIALPLARHESPFLNSNETIDLDAITSHGISVREKILSGLDNYQRNTRSMHPFPPFESSRDAGVPLTPTVFTHFWVTEISVGTPPRTLKVFIDTGSADMWVLGAGCTGSPPDRDFWNPKSSKSAKKYYYKWWMSNFQLRYTGGSIISGDLFTDIVTIGGLTANPQVFGSATSYIVQGQANREFPADGLLGLAYPSISKFGASPLFQSLVGQGRLTNPTFSLKLSPSGGQLYIGGANRQLYKGDITYTRITVPGFWQVPMDDVRVNGDKFFEHVPVIIDSGANFIFGDWDRVAELYRRLGGTLMDHTGFGYYYLPCNAFPTLGFTFGGRTFAFLPEAFRLQPISEGSPYCFGAVVAESRSMPSTSFWTIGAAFLQGVYSVFDYDNSRVGFADLA